MSCNIQDFLGTNTPSIININGPNIFKCSSCETGIQGPTGPPGNNGEQGEVGPTGINGEQGEVGPTGIKGEVGEVGPTGIQGEQGEVGPTGINGEQGEVGPTGSQGNDTGFTGPQGEQGPPGNDGVFPSGDINTFSCFNSTGGLQSLPQWSFDPSSKYNFGLNCYQNSDPVPTDPEDTSTYYAINRISPNVIPSGDSLQHIVGLNINSQLDPYNSGYNIGANNSGGYTNIDNSISYKGSGNIGYIRPYNQYLDIGNSTGGNIDNIQMINSSYTLRSCMTGNNSSHLTLNCQHETGTFDRIISIVEGRDE